MRRLAVAVAFAVGGISAPAHAVTITYPSCKAYVSSGRGVSSCTNLGYYRQRALMKCRTAYGDVVYAGPWVYVDGQQSWTGYCNGTPLWAATDWERK